MSILALSVNAAVLGVLYGYVKHCILYLLIKKTSPNEVNLV